MSGSNNSPPPSPTSLQQPRRLGLGRRLSKRPLMGAVALGAVLAGVAGYTLYDRQERGRMLTQQATDKGNAPESTDPRSLLGAPPTRVPEKVAGPSTETRARQEPAMQQAQEDLAERYRREAWETYFKDTAELRKMRLDRERAALAADPSFGQSGRQDSPLGQVPGAADMAGGGAFAAAGVSGLPGGGGQAVGAAGVGGVPGFGGSDPAGQSGKLAFLNQAGDPTGANEDLQATLHGPKPLTIMQGTPIAAVTLSASNSDLPGMIVGQVSQAVFDSATGGESTGRRPLIPAGSKVIINYDHNISAGQTRIGVVGTRIIFPDTSSIQLGSMEIADQSGAAGLPADVDTHMWEKFKNTLFLAIAGAGVQLSQPQQSVQGSYSPQSIAAAQLGQQFGQLGQEYARAGMAIPNTLSTKANVPFVIMVAKDIHLPPYVDRRSSTTATIGPVMR